MAILQITEIKDPHVQYYQIHVGVILYMLKYGDKRTIYLYFKCHLLLIVKVK
jgi:hypothetical protein